MSNDKNYQSSAVKQFLTDAFGRIWAVWAFIAFLVTFLIIFLPSMVAYLIPDPKGQTYFIAVSRWWMRVWLALVGCPLTVKGKENFKKGGIWIVYTTCLAGCALSPRVLWSQ